MDAERQRSGVANDASRERKAYAGRRGTIAIGLKV